MFGVISSLGNLTEQFFYFLISNKILLIIKIFLTEEKITFCLVYDNLCNIRKIENSSN